MKHPKEHYVIKGIAILIIIVFISAIIYAILDPLVQNSATDKIQKGKVNFSVIRKEIDPPFNDSFIVIDFPCWYFSDTCKLNASEQIFNNLSFGRNYTCDYDPGYIIEYDQITNCTEILNTPNTDI